MPESTPAPSSAPAQPAIRRQVAKSVGQLRTEYDKAAASVAEAVVAGMPDADPASYVKLREAKRVAAKAYQDAERAQVRDSKRK